MPPPTSPISTALALGSQGVATSFTVTITAGPTGIRVGDVGILLIYSHSGGGFFTPHVNSITDSLGNTWANSFTAITNVSKDLGIVASATQPTVSLCTAPMATPVAGGGTFTATITMNGSLTITEVDFISITNITLVSGNELSLLQAKDGVVAGSSTTFSSNTSHPTSNFFYIAFGIPIGTLVSYPTGYTAIPQFNGLISAAWFNNTTGATAADIWTQTPSSQYGAFQIGVTLNAPFVPLPGGTVPSSINGVLQLWNPDSQRLWVQKICSGSTLDTLYLGDSSSLAVVGTSPVTISLSSGYTMDAASLKNVGTQPLNITLTKYDSSTCNITLQPQGLLCFAGMEAYNSISLSTSSGTTLAEYLVAG